MSDLVTTTAALFRERFGRAPAAVGVAPGRVNLIGDHTDYADGFVMPIAINRWAAVALGPAAGTRTTIRAHDLDTEVALPLDHDSRRGDMSDYPRGVLAQLASPMPPVDLLIHSTVPIGAGLASSAAVEMATAVATTRWLDLDLDDLDLVRACRRAEHTFAGTPCGVMDMYIAAFGRAGHALCIDCRALTHEAVPLPDDIAILVVDTGVRHALAISAYPERRASCARAAATLGLEALRDASLGDLTHDGLDPTTRRRAQHVITENGRVQDFGVALRAGALDDAGQLMFGSHDSLRDDFAVSCPELDSLVDAARAIDGVFGARLTGGGFGGCAVLLVRPDAIDAVTSVIGSAFHTAHGRTPTMHRVQAVDGALVT